MGIAVSLLPEILRPSVGDIDEEKVNMWKGVHAVYMGEPICTYLYYLPQKDSVSLFDGANHSAYWLPQSFEK